MKKITFIILLTLLLVACAPKAAPAAAESAPLAVEEKEEAPSEPEVEPSLECTMDSTPQEVVFSASDGQELKGYYYPACALGSPVVVLMHWVGGDMSDWYEIAAWLQNRGLDNPFPTPGGFDWWDPSWFPTVDPAVSYGVFIFSFRGCEPYETGCMTMQKEGWLLDAQAAMQKATELEGVDPTRVAAIGSSIGADGAADACLWLNEQNLGACRGSLSLSPGDFLDVSYTETVKKLGEMNSLEAEGHWTWSWCYADEKEIAVCKEADTAGNPQLKFTEFPGGGHGNMLLSRGVEPSAMQGILDFLATIFTP